MCHVIYNDPRINKTSSCSRIQLAFSNVFVLLKWCLSVATVFVAKIELSSKIISKSHFSPKLGKAIVLLTCLQFEYGITFYPSQACVSAAFKPWKENLLTVKTHTYV